MIQETKETGLTVRVQGAVQINNAYIYQSGSNVCAVAVDMKTKRAKAVSVSEEGEAPEISVESCAGSVHLKEGVPVDSATYLSFPDFKGWTVWCVDVSKYTIHVCLVRTQQQ